MPSDGHENIKLSDFTFCSSTNHGKLRSLVSSIYYTLRLMCRSKTNIPQWFQPVLIRQRSLRVTHFEAFSGLCSSRPEITWYAMAKDWGVDDFKSECWMVASGVSGKMDLLAPGVWKDQACEHSFADKLKTKQVIAHELFHVYHAQINPGNDFNNVTGLDWLVEGFATYASGQLDTGRISGVKRIG